MVCRLTGSTAAMRRSLHVSLRYIHHWPDARACRQRCGGRIQVRPPASVATLVRPWILYRYGEHGRVELRADLQIAQCHGRVASLIVLDDPLAQFQRRQGEYE